MHIYENNNKLISINLFNEGEMYILLLTKIASLKLRVNLQQKIVRR